MTFNITVVQCICGLKKKNFRSDFTATFSLGTMIEKAGDSKKMINILFKQSRKSKFSKILEKTIGRREKLCM